MHLLLTLLEAIKRICTYKKGKPESSKKSSNKGEKGTKLPGTDSMARICCAHGNNLYGHGG